MDYLSTTSGISEVQLIWLFGNIGHQRAIAVGLVVASRIEEIEAVVVMDADGEDRPEDVSRLAAAWGVARKVGGLFLVAFQPVEGA